MPTGSEKFVLLLIDVFVALNKTRVTNKRKKNEQMKERKKEKNLENASKQNWTTRRVQF